MIISSCFEKLLSFLLQKLYIDLVKIHMKEFYICNYFSF